MGGPSRRNRPRANTRPTAFRPGSSGENDKKIPFGFGSVWRGLCSALPGFSTGFLRAALGVTVALYILNQKHLLPQPLSEVVSSTLFWPTLPITVAKRAGQWITVVDDTVVMGGAPFGFAHIPERLYEQYGVSDSVFNPL